LLQRKQLTLFAAPPPQTGQANQTGTKEQHGGRFRHRIIQLILNIYLFTILNGIDIDYATNGPKEFFYPLLYDLRMLSD